MSSSEIEQMALGWKKAVLKYKISGTPQKKYKFTAKADEVLRFFRAIEHNPQTKIISLEKAPQLKDIPAKIWRTAKRIKYIPMMIRSKRNERLYRRSQDK